MADSSHTLIARTLVLAVALALACAAVARADGDPASDILPSQSLFLPADAGIGATPRAQLQALPAVARRAGYPIRVAVIASRADLGAITELWGRPAAYARYLGAELALTYRGPLLVVMPAGYGLSRVGRERSVLAGRRPGPALGPATLDAVQRLAARAGHPLPGVGAIAPSSRPGAGDPWPWIAFGVGAVLIALAWTASVRARPLGGRRP